MDRAYRHFEILSPFLNDLIGATSSVAWSIDVLRDVPQQQNGYDCGLCTCVNMELLSRTGVLSQYQMDDRQWSEETRKKVSVEIMFGELLC